MINESFRINKNFAIDICLLYNYREFSDGIDFLEIKMNYDKYIGDHNPQFNLWISILNFCLIDINIYNIHHVGKESSMKQLKNANLCYNPRHKDYREFEKVNEELGIIKKFRKSGFEDDKDDLYGKICNYPEHNPPMHLYIPPRKRYRHECPSCGYTVIMRGSNTTL